MELKEVLGMFARYVVLLFLGLFGIRLFYAVFSPLTAYPSYWLSNLVFGGAEFVPPNLILIGSLTIELIPACIAGAAYYLLLILNLTTPMHVVKRIKSLAFLILTFLVINIMRIVTFIVIASRGTQYFDAAHLGVWYFGSTVMIVILWFVNVWVFNIRAIPVYTDFSNLIAEMTRKPKKRKKKRK
ncbi:pacearchaeosortase [Candidatus Pacearchaeota archaeon]|nr:MAG: pacearchaeosortase [Candidatus Pacearchaeota archaeon]